MRWVVLILLIGTSLCMGESTKYPKKFVVRKSEGNVLVWQPWKSAWETVTTGDKIWENTLVQVGNEGSLTFGVEAAEPPAECSRCVEGRKISKAKSPEIKQSSAAS